MQPAPAPPEPTPDPPVEPPHAEAPVPVATPRPGPGYVFLVVVSLLSLVADLGTKFWAEKTLQSGDTPMPKQIIKGVFGFILAKNKGGAWGLLQNQSEKIRKPFFVIVSVLAIVFIVSLYRRLNPKQVALKWGLPLVLGGALGNLVDRIRYGYVIDFIDFQATWENLPHHWPTFNVADIAICIGVALMALDMLSGKKLAPAPLPPAPSAPAHDLPPAA